MIDWTFEKVNTTERTHVIHKYPARLVPQIARTIITKYSSPHDHVIDPFVGSGTVLIESVLSGRKSTGIDINPLACLISKVRTTPVDTSNLSSLRAKIISTWDDTKPDSIDFFNIDYWFKPGVKDEINKLRSHILNIKNIDQRNFFKVVFSQVVRNASNTRNGEFKLYRYDDKKLKKFSPDVKKMFSSLSEAYIRGLDDFIENYNKLSFGKKYTPLIFNGDFRDSHLNSKYDLILTSPPYGDSKTTVSYEEFSRLTLQWLGIEDEMRKNRNKMLGQRKKCNYKNLESETFDKIYNEINIKNTTRATDVLSFFLDLNASIKKMSQLVKNGKYTVFVIGNRTVAGTRVMSNKIISEICEAKYGFEHIKTYRRKILNKYMPRINGPSNKEGKTSKTMMMEHIIILKKVNF